MTPFIFIGVDPGKMGAIAAVNESGTVLGIRKFAEADTEGRIALIVMDFIADLDPDCVHAATIEKVHAMPGQGVSSTFVFGRVYGEAWSGLLASKARVASVSPVVWQRDMALPKRHETDNHKRTLKQEAEARFGRKFTLSEADAVWLAEWGRCKGPWSRGMRAVP